MLPLPRVYNLTKIPLLPHLYLEKDNISKNNLFFRCLHVNKLLGYLYRFFQIYLVSSYTLTAKIRVKSNSLRKTRSVFRERLRINRSDVYNLFYSYNLIYLIQNFLRNYKIPNNKYT